MHTITRRALLGALPLVPASGGAWSASPSPPLSDTGQPTHALLGPPLEPHALCRWLAEELSLALPAVWNGRFHAVVHPAEPGSPSVGFVNTSAWHFHESEAFNMRSAARAVVRAFRAKAAAYEARRAAPEGVYPRPVDVALIECANDLHECLEWLAEEVDGRSTLAA